MITEEMCGIIMDTIAEIVVLFDGEGRIYYGNRAALEDLSYTEEALRQCTMSQFFIQEFQPQGSGKEAPFDVERIRDLKETAMYREMSSCFPVSTKVFDVEGGKFLLVAEDITWQKEMDKRISKLKEEEEIQRKVQTEFTANVTHELRTPVNGIKGHISTLIESVEDKDQKRILEIVLYCCDNMSSIINNILDFSKIGAGKFLLDEIEFDFYKLMDNVIETHMAEIRRKELGISVYISENIPRMLVGDSLRIGQILNNLLSNAVKFTMVGKISVDVSKTYQRGDEVELFFLVKDTGIGISKEEQDKLFQSFRQVDASVTRKFGGTGLGLSITKELVEMMGGMIHLDSEKGKGSCFSFSLKLRLGESEANDSENLKMIQEWNSKLASDEDSETEELYIFGSEKNKQEIGRRLEKLMLSIELDSWDKAEIMADTIKAMTDQTDAELKRIILRLEMAIRKENYDKSMEAYGKLKEALEARIGLQA